MFVTFEGPDGSGKSTQVRLLAEWLAERHVAHLTTFEPGGTDLGVAVRRLLLDRSASPPTARTEAVLFAAARTQLVDSVIRPALAAGTVVICDRYADSTIAYQGCGRGLPCEDLAALVAFATGGLEPDLTFLCDLDVETGLARRRGSKRPGRNAGERADRIEAEELAFHERVRRGYLQIAALHPERIVVLDASQPQKRIADLVRREMERRSNHSRE